jgi:threonine-phosphate decarboxylase
MAMIHHGGGIFEFAEARRIDWRQVLDFSASINPLGASPAAREAILAALDRVVHYPSRSGQTLRKRLAGEWNIPENRIAVGNGSTELLFDWCRVVGTGTIATPAFGEFHRAWPEAKLCSLTDRDSWPTHGPVVFTRPANPTGTILDAQSLLTYARSRRDDVLVDESFLDFVPGQVSLVPEAGGNLWVLRSMTKFWALPGLRVGALLGDVERLAGSRPPWTLNTLAEQAALASLDDSEHARRTRQFVAEESRWLYDQLSAIDGLRPWVPSANYVFVEADRDRVARLVSLARDRNILLRNCADWPGLDVNGFRVAVRRRWENEVLLECLCG